MAQGVQVIARMNLAFRRPLKSSGGERTSQPRDPGPAEADAAGGRADAAGGRAAGGNELLRVQARLTRRCAMAASLARPQVAWLPRNGLPTR